MKGFVSTCLALDLLVTKEGRVEIDDNGEKTRMRRINRVWLWRASVFVIKRVSGFPK